MSSGACSKVLLDAEAVEYEPTPAALIAATRKMYCVPGSNPPTVVVGSAEIASLYSLHVVPASEEY